MAIDASGVPVVVEQRCFAGIVEVISRRQGWLTFATSAMMLGAAGDKYVPPP